MFGFFKKIFGFFKKKPAGVAILEAVLTLPIIMSVTFFSIELVRVGLAQTAVDSIAKECTFSLMSTGKVANFDEIFAKYKPWGISIGNFRYYIRIYADDDVSPITSDKQGIYKMMASSPYGGETIGWAGTDYSSPSASSLPTTNASSLSYGLTSSCALFNKYQTSIIDGTGGEIGEGRKTLLEQDSGVPSGCAFVLTVAVKFPFSSKFVEGLFNGGTNTDKTGVYILWARGSGLVN